MELVQNLKRGGLLFALLCLVLSFYFMLKRRRKNDKGSKRLNILVVFLDVGTLDSIFLLLDSMIELRHPNFRFKFIEHKEEEELRQLRLSSEVNGMDSAQFQADRLTTQALLKQLRRGVFQKQIKDLSFFFSLTDQSGFLATKILEFRLLTADDLLSDLQNQQDLSPHSNLLLLPCLTNEHKQGLEQSLSLQFNQHSLKHEDLNQQKRIYSIQAGKTIQQAPYKVQEYLEDLHATMVSEHEFSLSLQKQSRKVRFLQVLVCCSLLFAGLAFKLEFELAHLPQPTLVDQWSENSLIHAQKKLEQANQSAKGFDLSYVIQDELKKRLQALDLVVIKHVSKQSIRP